MVFLSLVYDVVSKIFPTNKKLSYSYRLSMNYILTESITRWRWRKPSFIPYESCNSLFLNEAEVALSRARFAIDLFNIGNLTQFTRSLQLSQV